MIQDNAYQFALNYIYSDQAREDRCKQTNNDDELIQLIVYMAQNEQYPTGVFNEDDVRAMLDDYATRDPGNVGLFKPPTYTTMIKLFRQGLIAGNTGKW